MSFAGYGTHFPILAAAFHRVGGPVLELGCGDFSTPMLHYLCKGSLPQYSHRLVTADMDMEWLAKFREYGSPSHDFFLIGKPEGEPKVTMEIQGWRDWPMIEEHQWGLVFIDCAPGEARHELAIRVANRARLVICHDSETDHGAAGNYQYDKAKAHFKYVTEFRRWRPYTLCLSNVAPFEIEECDRVWVPE